jgi:type III pantothenate kinase
MNSTHLLTIKIGNSNIGFGIFEGDKLVCTWRCETRVETTADEYAALLLTFLDDAQVQAEAIRAAAIVSVVPPLTATMQDLCTRYFQVEPFIAGPGARSSIRIRYDDPRALGADRLVSLVAAKAKYGAPCLVIDFGTATTFNALDARGDFVGGAIAPGINMAADALHQFTAKLPRIEIAAPPHALATNTRDALRSGIFFGYVGLVEGLVTRLHNEMKEPNARVIATGGMSTLLAADCPPIEIVDPDLALEGLRMLYEARAA